MKDDNDLNQGTNEKKCVNSRYVLEIELVDIEISSLFFYACQGYSGCCVKNGLKVGKSGGRESSYHPGTES